MIESVKTFSKGAPLKKPVQNRNSIEFGIDLMVTSYLKLALNSGLEIESKNWI